MHCKLSASLLLVACLGAIMPILSARASEATDDGAIERYPAAYFAAAAPDNAWDMLLRLPGFHVIEADEDVRGYQGARGNVWIDNAWPASKHESIEDLLKRIPAGVVQGIELIHSGAQGVDLGGFNLVANVRRRHDATSTGLAEAGVAAATDGWMAPRGRLEYNLRSDARSLDLALKIDPELDDDSGRGSIRTSAPGAEAPARRWDTTTRKHRAEATASLRQALGGGDLTLTLGARSENERIDSRLAAGTDAEAERNREAEDTRQHEINARFRRQLGEATTLELLASRHASRVRDDEHSLEGDEAESFRSTNHSREDILRAALQRQFSPTLAFAAALESAVNSLDSAAQLQQGGTSTNLPGSDVGVEERRSEASISATWTPVERFSLEAGLRAERSRIRVEGDAQRQRAFVYPKPRLALRVDAGPADRLLLSIEREIGQLDFEDFAASASLDNNVVSAGNADLVPDKTWRLGTRWEHRIGAAGSIAIGWNHDRIEDVIDRVPIVDGEDVFDAPGNIGRGKRDTLELDLSLPLEAIGVAGGRLRATVAWQHSRVTDPVTGASRPISGAKPVDGEIAFTQDLPSMRANWGVTLDHLAERKTKYRYDRIERESERMGWSVYFERGIGHAWRLRCEATDLFGRGFSTVREKFDGPHGRSTPTSIERRQRRAPGTFSVVLRRDFGGG